MHVRPDHRPSSHDVKGGYSPGSRRRLVSPQVPHAAEILPRSWNSCDAKAVTFRHGAEAICYHGDDVVETAKESESHMTQILRDGEAASEND